MKVEEVDIMSLPLATKKKRATMRKSVFTRHINTLQRHIDRWRTDPVSSHLKKIVTESLSQVRKDKERVLEIYECIQADDSVSELVFSGTFQPRMSEIETSMEEVETRASDMFIRCREAREAKVESQRDTGGQTGGNQAGGRGADGGGASKWHIQKAFKPKHSMNLAMTMQEVHIGYREWDHYYQVSKLDQASFNINKLIFIQCISEEMMTRIDSEMENCTLVEEMKELVTEEFEKRNPRMVLRHMDEIDTK